MARHKDVEWDLADKVDYQVAQLAVLMDIRAELRELNRKWSCYRIPRAMDAMHRIDRRLAKRVSLTSRKKR